MPGHAEVGAVLVVDIAAQDGDDAIIDLILAEVTQGLESAGKLANGAGGFESMEGEINRTTSPQVQEMLGRPFDLLNVKRSHAGSLVSDETLDGHPALADASGSAF
jgi:hypothetical protein